MRPACVHSSSPHIRPDAPVPRLLLILGLTAAVAAILLGYRFRVMMAGGKAVLMLIILGALVWFALSYKRSRR